MNPTLLREVYRRHGIKKKFLRWTKQARVPDPEADRKWLSDMKRKLTKAKNDGFRLIYADECMVTRKSVPLAEWAHKHENMTVD